YETCEILKADNATAHIPIIFYSSKFDVESKIKCFEVGGQDFLHKPVQKEELIAHISTHIALQQLQANLRQEVENKIKLIRILSHDISNPLTAIACYADIIMAALKRNDFKDLPDKIKRIQKSARQIREIIEQVRKMEALKSNKIEIDLKPVYLQWVFRDLYEAYEEKLKKKNLSLEFSPPLEKLDVGVMADRVSLYSNILSNLLSNAVKFSFPGKTINMAVKESIHSVTITIKDEGIGIPEEMLERIFSMSVATSRNGTAGEKGTGFGMPIVKSYVELYGGHLRISSKCKDESPVDHGTEIKLVLKKAKIPKEARADRYL
ncbi:MAG: GHKL domain-containing protein, partial [bacterium]|nr:GHKL domain-containing protein [bacterium]